MFMLAMRALNRIAEREKIMAGTRTAPEVDGAPNQVVVSIRLIDASGDKWSEPFYFNAAPTDLQIESLVASYVATSQASVYEVTVAHNYQGAALASNAESNMRYGVESGINLLYRDTLNTEQTVSHRVVSPVTSVMDGDKDIPLIATAPLSTLISNIATLEVVSLESAQYTTRRERRNNPRVTP